MYAYVYIKLHATISTKLNSILEFLARFSQPRKDNEVLSAEVRQDKLSCNNPT